MDNMLAMVQQSAAERRTARERNRDALARGMRRQDRATVIEMMQIALLDAYEMVEAATTDAEIWSARGQICALRDIISSLEKHNNL